MKQQSLRFGFTILEMVISLAIICSFATISIYGLKDYQSRVEEQQFLESFKSTFKNVFNYCYLNKTAATIDIYPKTNIIIFEFNKTYRKSIRMKLPKSLEVSKSLEKTYYISQKGMSSPETISFYSKLKHKCYIYKIQMSWGEVIEKSS